MRYHDSLEDKRRILNTHFPNVSFNKEIPDSTLEKAITLLEKHQYTLTLQEFIKKFSKA